MRVESLEDERGVRLLFVPDAGDRPVSAAGARLVRREVLLHGDGPALLHPDVAALLALLCVTAFVGSPLRMDRGVSQSFATLVRQHLGRSVGPVDPAVRPRPRPAGGPVALCFSGGADSFAALSVLPGSSHAVHLYRTTPPELEGWEGYCRRDELFATTAPLRACEAVRSSGRQVRVVGTDLEYLRHPVGFPSDLASAAAVLAIADTEGYAGISWGTVAESAYLVGRGPWHDYAARPDQVGWRAVFDAVGLPVVNPTAALSEVVTTRLAAEGPWSGVVESCARAEGGVPCRNCWKCFRKSLGQAAATGNWPSDHELDLLFAAPRVRKYLSGAPIKHESVLRHVSQVYPGGHPMMAALGARLGPAQDVGWMTRAYGPALDLLPDDVRPDVARRLGALGVDTMATSDEAAFRACDIVRDLGGPDDRARLQVWRSQLESHATAYQAQQVERRRLRAEQRAEQRAAALAVRAGRTPGPATPPGVVAPTGAARAEATAPVRAHPPVPRPPGSRAEAAASGTPGRRGLRAARRRLWHLLRGRVV